MRHRLGLSLALALANIVSGCADESGNDALGDTSSATEPATDDGDDGRDDGDDDADGTPTTTSDPADTSADDAPNDDDGEDDTDDDTTDDGGTPMGLGPSEGCGKTPGAITSGMITAAGIDRQYILQLPDDYDPNKPYPLVFGFHGYTENMETARWRFRVGEEWNGEAIGIYPQGRYIASVGGNNWEYGATSPDIAFFDALANAAAQELCIDLDRIFAAGFSAGGYFTHSLMCFRGDYLRAASPSGAGMATNACGDGVAMWSAHATNDEIVPYQNGVSLREFWRSRNGCSGATAPWPGDPMCVQYEGCDEPLVWCDYDDGHWFMDDWKSPAIAQFFQQFGPL